MGKENFDDFGSPSEGINLDSAYSLIEDLQAMQEKSIPIDKLTMKELQGKIKELMDLQQTLGPSAAKEIGTALVKLRNIHSKHMESLEEAV